MKETELENLAMQVMQNARDRILMHFRFLDVALSGLSLRARKGAGGIYTDGKNIHYDSVYVLRMYRQEQPLVARCILHMLLHLLFYHPFGYDKLQKNAWDLAADAAVEGVLIAICPGSMALMRDNEIQMQLDTLAYRSGSLTAEKLYRLFRVEGISKGYEKQLGELLLRDLHTAWEEPEKLEITKEQWEKLSRQVKTDIKTFSKGKVTSKALEDNLASANKDKYDYSGILRRFMTTGEEMKQNDEEFDYVYYSFGCAHYGNMPLIEPLEYADVKKVRDFVIVIDTSASCRGKIVQSFLQKTYSILMSQENFFTTVHIHILQCDQDVQSDTVVHSVEEFEAFIQNGKLTGFGATDFRPAFSYVEKLQQQGKLSQLKGLIYFTDGYGIYPENVPRYDVIFAFLGEDENRPTLPPWAIKVVLEEEQLEEEN